MNEHRKILTDREPPTGTATLRTWISGRDLADALGPALRGIGVPFESVLVDGFAFTGRRIAGFTTEPLAGVEPVSSETVTPGREGIWVWPFSIEVIS